MDDIDELSDFYAAKHAKLIVENEKLRRSIKNIAFSLKETREELMQIAREALEECRHSHL